MPGLSGLRGAPRRVQRIGKGQADAGASEERGKLQAAPAGAAKPGHTGITPGFHPNHGESESGTRTGLGINRDGTIFRTSN